MTTIMINFLILHFIKFNLISKISNFAIIWLSKVGTCIAQKKKKVGTCKSFFVFVFERWYMCKTYKQSLAPIHGV